MAKRRREVRSDVGSGKEGISVCDRVASVRSVAFQKHSKTEKLLAKTASKKATERRVRAKRLCDDALRGPERALKELLTTTQRCDAAWDQMEAHQSELQR